MVQVQDIFLAWILFPIFLLLISVSIGIGVRYLTKNIFELSLVLPVGFASLILILQFLTFKKFTVVFALPIVMMLTAICIINARQVVLQYFRENRLQLLVGFITNAIYSVPIWASGAPTFAGWIKLDDGSTWLAFADRLTEAGRNTIGLQPSTYEATLQLNLSPSADKGPGYPIGAFLPLGGISKLIGVDSAWALQPYMSFLAGMLAMILFVALKNTVISPVIRACISVLSSCSSLLFGYAMWGGVKELLLAPFFAILIYFGISFSPGKNLIYPIVPFAIIASAFIAVAGPSGAIWVFVPLICLLVRVYRFYEISNVWRVVRSLFLVSLILCIPAIFISNILNLNSLFFFAKSSDDIGNLVGHIDRREVLGIWPSGDFRFPPNINQGPLNLALLIVLGLVLLGIFNSYKSKDFFVAIIAVNAFFYTLLFSFGNAWIGGKAMAVSSPFLLLAALVGIYWLLQSERVVEAVLSSIIVGGGVVVSLALTYHEVWLAPYAQLKELQQIGDDQSLSGPTLMLEYSPYGSRHFLRNLTTESAGELRRNLIPLKSGQGVEKGNSADIDEFPLTSINPYKTLVLQRSPSASRPPSNYRLAYSKRFYEVWQQDIAAKNITEHISFGNISTAGEVPSCSRLKTIAERAGTGAFITTVVRDRNISVNLGQNVLPNKWSSGSKPGSVIAPNSGLISNKINIAETGNYSIWIGGSFRGQIKIFVDGKQELVDSSQINHAKFIELGQLTLSAGAHTIDLKYSNSIFKPGTGGYPFEFGPIVLSKSSTGLPLTTIKPSQIDSLCGKNLDWIEIQR